MPKVAINLVTWNGAKFVEQCLKSAANQSYKDFSVLIIDNGSTDETAEIICERFPQWKIIRHRENLGFAKAHNQAIHWTDSEYVLCLNQDVVLAPDFLAEAVKFLDAHQLCAAISGKIYRLQDDQMTKYVDSLGLKIYKNFRVIDRECGVVDEGQFDNPEEVFGASGAVPVYRRKALEEVRFQQEFFDESFFSYKEDVDLAFRLRLAGWQCWFVPSAAAYHERTVSAPLSEMTRYQVAQNRRRKSAFANFHSYRNHLYFLIKCLPKFSLRVFLYEALKFIFVLFFEPKNLRAWRDVFANWKILRQKRTLIWKNAKVGALEIIKWLV